MSDEINYFAIIPCDVMYNKDLPANAKLLYGTITSLTHKEGYCYASNAHLAEYYGVTPQAISKWVKLLENFGFIKIEYIYDGNEVSMRKIYILETAHKDNSSEEVSTNIDTVSTNDCEGINKRLKGYQQKIKVNNINSIIKFNNINSNSHCDEGDTSSLNKKSKKSDSFKQSDYSDVFNAYLTNCKTLFEQGKIPVERPVIPNVIKKTIKLRFTTYGVESVVNAVRDSINNTWLVNTAHYSITALLSENVLTSIINKTYQGASGSYSQSKPVPADKMFF